MPVIYNPTDEILVGRYDGTDTILKPGDKLKVDTPRAKHILTQLEPRGLLILDYGDEGDVIKKKEKGALKRQTAFEKKQVRFYNIDNEKRKRENKPWVSPPPAVERYALKHSISLVEYYSESDTKAEALAEAANKASQASKENRELKEQILEMSAMVKELMSDKIERNELKVLDGRTKEAKELKEKLEGLKEKEE